MRFIVFLVILSIFSNALLITSVDSISKGNISKIRIPNPPEIITPTPTIKPLQLKQLDETDANPETPQDKGYDLSEIYPCSKYKDLFEEVAAMPLKNGKSFRDYQLDGAILGAIATVESRCGKNLIGYSGGDFGLMQVNKIHFDSCQLTKETATYDHLKNTICAAKILLGGIKTTLKYKNMNGKDAITIALLGYNSGSGYTDKLASLVSQGRTISDAFKIVCTNSYCSQPHRLLYPSMVLKHFPQNSYYAFASYADQIRRSYT